MSDKPLTATEILERQRVFDAETDRLRMKVWQDIANAVMPHLLRASSAIKWFSLKPPRELTEQDKAVHRAIGFSGANDSNRLGSAQYVGPEE